jgi:hypothetical protein
MNAPALRRIAIGGAVALLVGGAGVAVTMKRKAISDGWTAIERHIPRSAWASIRRQATHAWSTVRHQALDAWASVSRRLPFGGKQGDSVASAQPALRDASDSRGTHQRKTASTSKRSRDR